jgi:hypothetical protein
LIASAVKDLARCAIIKGFRAQDDAGGRSGNRQGLEHTLCSKGASIFSRRKEQDFRKEILFYLESGDRTAIKNQNSLLWR